MSIVKNPSDNYVAQEGNANGDAFVMGHGNTVVATLVKEDLAADEGFILVDLSDTTNFPHSETGKIRIYTIDIEYEVKADGQFILYVGTIIEVDATDGSTKWLFAVDAETVSNPTDSTDRRHIRYHWPGGIDLEVSAGAMVNLISNVGDTNDVTWQTDVNLDSPVGDTSSPSGAGDLVAFLDETGGTGTFDFSITVEYITEA